MLERYNISNLKTALNRPSLFVWEGHRVLSKPVHLAGNYYFQNKYRKGVDVISRDWDTLVILDACRYDYYMKQRNIEGSLESVVSGGSNSWPYMQHNFNGRTLHDSVYVTANPHARKLNDGVFHAMHTVLDRWDEEIGTVQPQDVVKAALEANESYPNKRLIVHFMQPHRPYIGPTADRLRQRVDLQGYNRNRGTESQTYERTGISMWDAVKTGKVARSELRQAYQESLDIVLEQVSDLIKQIDGRTVITADHGEMLGDRVFWFTNRLYGHPGDIKCPQLRIVPWHIVEGSERRLITTDEPVGDYCLDEELIQDRLQALGYV